MLFYSTSEIDILMIIANNVRISGTDCEEVKVTEKNEVKEMRLLTIETGMRAWVCLDFPV
jgi:hypothetical protein